MLSPLVTLFLALAALGGCTNYQASNEALYRGDYDTATAGYRQDLASSPNNVVVLRKLGYALYKNGQFADSVTAFEKVLAMRPNDPDATFFLGLAYVGLGQREQGLQVLMRYKDWTRALMQQTIQDAAQRLSHMPGVENYQINDVMIEARDYGYCLQRTASMDPFSAEGDPRWERLNIPLSKNATCVSATI